jgi:hypothetical protein
MGGPGSIPGQGCCLFLSSLTGAMVARLPTEQEVVGSIPTLGWSLCSRSSVGRSSASHAEGPGFDPLRELGLLISRKVERSIRPENLGFRFIFVRYGVVGNMSGSHPVASGSIPGIGCAKFLLCVLLAQLAEHPLNIQMCER